MYVSIYAWMYVCSVCMYVCIHVCNVCMYVRTYVRMYVYIYVITYVFMYVWMYVCMCVYVCMYVCNVYMYVCMCAYVNVFNMWVCGVQVRATLFYITNKTLGVISKFRLSANLVTDSHEASALVALLVPEGVQITVFWHRHILARFANGQKPLHFRVSWLEIAFA